MQSLAWLPPLIPCHVSVIRVREKSIAHPTVNRDSGFVIRESCDAENKKPIRFENRLYVDQTSLHITSHVPRRVQGPALISRSTGILTRVGDFGP